MPINIFIDAEVRAPIYAKMWKSTLFHGFRGELFNARGVNQMDILQLIFSQPFNFEELNTYHNNMLHSTAANGDGPLMEAVIKQLKEHQVNFTKMLNERNGYRVDDAMIYLVRGKDRGKAAWHYVEVNRSLLSIFLKRTDGGTLDVAQYGRIIQSGWGRDPDEATKESIHRISHISPDHFENDQTPLHIAVSKRKLDVAKILVSNKADLNITDKYGLTPLHLAAVHGHMELVKLLLSNNADSTVKDVQGKTAAEVAHENEHYKVYEFMKAYKGS